MFSKRIAKSALGGLALFCVTAFAEPGYYLVAPYESEGRMAVDYRYWTVKPPGRPVRTWPEVGVSYGFSPRWTSGLLASFIGGAHRATRLETLNWHNDVLLTQGQYPFDLALHGKLVWYRDRSEGQALEFGPVFQTDVGRVQLNTNVLFERSFGATQASPTQLKVQWQLKYRFGPLLHLGLQGFGELGTWDDWSAHARQSHRIGPMLAGSWLLAPQQELKYQAAYLMGKTYGAKGDMFSMQVKLEF